MWWDLVNQYKKDKQSNRQTSQLSISPFLALHSVFTHLPFLFSHICCLSLIVTWMHNYHVYFIIVLPCYELIDSLCCFVVWYIINWVYWVFSVVNYPSICLKLCFESRVTHENLLTLKNIYCSSLLVTIVNSVLVHFRIWDRMSG